MSLHSERPIEGGYSIALQQGCAPYGTTPTPHCICCKSSRTSGTVIGLCASSECRSIWSINASSEGRSRRACRSTYAFDLGRECEPARFGVRAHRGRLLLVAEGVNLVDESPSEPRGEIGAHAEPRRCTAATGEQRADTAVAHMVVQRKKRDLRLGVQMVHIVQRHDAIMLHPGEDRMRQRRRQVRDRAPALARRSQHGRQQVAASATCVSPEVDESFARRTDGERMQQCDQFRVAAGHEIFERRFGRRR